MANQEVNNSSGDNEVMADQSTQGNKESYESRKQEKMQARKQQSQGHKNKRKVKPIIIGLIVVVVLAYLGWLLVKSSSPQEEDMSRAIPSQGAAHVNVGSVHAPYNSNPPTSGPHYSQTARTGFRDEPIADENIIHNLEHGDIWISYHPRVPDGAVQELKDFAGTKVIVTSREANDTDIALSAWGRLDTFNLENGNLDTIRIDDFIKRYINKGPERVPAGAHRGI